MSFGFYEGSQFQVETLFKSAIEQKASDIHVVTNRLCSMRVKENIVQTNIKINEEDLGVFCTRHTNGNRDEVTEFYENRRFSADFAVSFENRRFRGHLYKSNNNICGVFRLLSEKIPDLITLNLPDSVNMFTQATSGLILICGATGSGKTTTIASIINKINEIRAEAIITIEDPIEYIYEEKMAVIEQREVGTHVESFNQATIDALREDPDIIVVGEMRDLETIKNAITLAETGHLVFGTLHTKSSIDAIDRMVDIFPPEQQQQIRVQLASILYGVMHQQLIKSKSTGKIVALCEVMIVDNVLASNIKQPNKNQASALKDYIRNNSKNGCVHIVDNCLWHIKKGRIRVEDIKHYLSEEDLRLLQARMR